KGYVSQMYELCQMKIRKMEMIRGICKQYKQMQRQPPKNTILYCLSLYSKRLFLFLFLLLASHWAFAQNQPEDCGCPENRMAGTKADTLFRLSNGKKIAL